MTGAVLRIFNGVKGTKMKMTTYLRTENSLLIAGAVVVAGMHQQGEDVMTMVVAGVVAAGAGGSVDEVVEEAATTDRHGSMATEGPRCTRLMRSMILINVAQCRLRLWPLHEQRANTLPGRQRHRTCNIIQIPQRI